MKASRSHHLAKHSLASEVDVKLHFGSTDPKEIAREIAKLGQKQLQAKFNQLFSAKTYSNNNQWLRRKLLEAAGLQAPKAQGRARSGQAQPRRSASPANASTTTSAPSCDTGAIYSHQPPIQHKVDRATPLPAGKEEVRRTKRQRRPRTFEDMLLLDSPACSSDSRSQQDILLSELEPLPSAVGPKPMRKAVSPAQLLPGPGSRWRLSRHGSSSHFSDVSAQSSLAFSRLFEARHPSAAAALAPHYQLKPQKLCMPAESLDEQLIRAGSLDSTSDLLHQQPSLYSRGNTASLPLHHYVPQQQRPQRGGSLQLDAFDLGAGRVRIATPHNRMAPSRTVNIQLTAPRDEAAPEAFLQAQQQQQQQLLHSRRGGVSSGGLGDAEAFANSVLDAEAIGAGAVFESRAQSAEWKAHLSHAPVELAYLPPFNAASSGAGLSQGSLVLDGGSIKQQQQQQQQQQQLGSPRASSLGSQASLTAGSAAAPLGDGSAAAAAAQLGEAALGPLAPLLQGPGGHPSSPHSAASTTPMDLIMLQNLAMGSVPLDSGPAAEPLLADPLPAFLLDTLLPPAA